MARRLFLGLILVLAGISQAFAQSSQSASDAILILDASGSMWARMDGEPRIVVAKNVINDLLDELPESTRLGLMAYGHSRKGDCGDIEMLVDVGGDRETIKEAVDNVSPKGKTPMTDAVIQAAEKLKYTENPATVILVSDGEETCNVDPCEAAAKLDELGVELKVHTVGFALEEGSEGLNQLQCMADNTGGQFFATQNAEELATALTSITEEEPDEPATYTVDLSATEEEDGPVITEGLIWALYEEDSDDPLYTSEPTGKVSTTLEPGTYTASVLRISDEADAEATLKVEDQDTQLTLPIEAEHNIALEGPDTVAQGSAFDVSWSETTSENDRVIIVPADTKEGERAGGSQAQRVRTHSSGSLKAPGTPGLYELRYVRDQDNKTLDARAIEVVETEVTVEAPETVVQGSSFEVSWSEGINGSDRVIIVPADADESDRGRGSQALRVRSNTSGTLRAPATPGLYEVRYWLDQGSKTMATQAVEVVETEVSLEVSRDVIRAGETLDVTWGQPVNSNDLIMILPAGTEEGHRARGGQAVRARSNTKGTLTAPDDPGLYEVRYMLDQDRATMATVNIEVVDADAPLDDGAGLQAPAQAKTGETLTATWSRDSEGDERIALAQDDQPDFSWISAEKAGEDQKLELTMPDKAGTYEIRYLDITNREVLGRTLVKVE